MIPIVLIENSITLVNQDDYLCAQELFAGCFGSMNGFSLCENDCQKDLILFHSTFFLTEVKTEPK